MSANTVDGNGFRGAVPGDGNPVFGSGNRVEANSASNNAAGGISVARPPPTAGSFPGTNPNGRNNQLTRNRAFGNGFADLCGLQPEPRLRRQRVSGNQGRVAIPECTRNP